MLRYYLDSNIYQLMKQAHPFHRPDLLNTVDQITTKVLFVFSDAHLDDLRTSLNPYRDEDLSFIGNYVQDNYFAVDIYLKFQLWLADPLTAFNGKNYQAVDDFYANPDRIGDIFNTVDDIHTVDLLKGLYDSILKRPISSIAPLPSLEEMDDESRQFLQKFLPDYSPNMTLKQLMQNNITFSAGFKDDKKELREIRKHISKFMNRDDYSWDKWRREFNIKFKDTKLDKTFVEFVENLLVNDQKDSLYHKVTYAYTMLELYNITEERTKKGPKQFTFTSLNQDAQHVYYASHADYLVTDDRGMQLKAFIVYELFNISTKVLTVEDFINRSHTVLASEESYDSFCLALEYDLKHSFEVVSKQDLASNKFVRIYKTTYDYFNYFNRIQCVTNDGPERLIIYCERRSAANFVMFRENELLANKLIKAFGQDDENKGMYIFEEEKEIELYRKWTLGNIVYELKTVEFYLCLYITIAIKD